MNEDIKTDLSLSRDELRQAEVGVVGIGAMGAGIVAFLLVAGHRVRAIEPVAANIPVAQQRVVKYIDSIEPKYRPQNNETMLELLTISDDYADLKSCAVVLESVLENLEVKHEVIRRIEEYVEASTLIGTNTSALPITQIQQGAQHPGRVLGMHTGMPPLMPLMEIIKGNHTTDAAIARAAEYARFWGKDPSIVQKDIRGFIANRLGYAMYREALHLYASGVASPADIDRAARYALGVWAGYEGPFGPLDNNFDLMQAVMREIFPDLCNDKEVPPFLEEMYRSGQRHFYDKSAEFNLEAERRHLEGMFKMNNQALAQLDEIENE